MKEAGSTLRVTEDRHGYRWMVLGDPDTEDLVTSATWSTRPWLSARTASATKRAMVESCG